MEKKMSASKISITAASVFSALWSVASVALMVSHRERGDYGYTGAMDYTIRLILLLVCAACFVVAMGKLVLLCLRNGDVHRGLSETLLWLNMGILCAVVVVGISLYREFQNSARLLEDVMYLVLTLAAGMALLIGRAMAGNKRGVFISGLIAVIALGTCTLLGFALFRENTYRSLDLVYYAHRIGYTFPFLTLCLAAKLFLPRSEVRIVAGNRELVSNEKSERRTGN